MLHLLLVIFARFIKSTSNTTTKVEHVYIISPLREEKNSLFIVLGLVLKKHSE